MDNKEKIKAVLNCRVCECDLLWQHPIEKGMCIASSDFIDGYDVCHSCMVEHCVHTECSDCIIGYYALRQGGICRFWELKEYYMMEDNEDGEQEEKEET